MPALSNALDHALGAIRAAGDLAPYSGPSGGSGDGADLEPDALDAELEAARRAARIRGYKARLDAAGIPLRFRGALLSNLTPSLAQEAEKADALAAARALVRDGSVRHAGQERACLLLLGSYGTGKTTLATAAFKELLWDGRPGLWRKAYQLVREVQQAYGVGGGEAGRLIRAAQTCGVLLLDDLGDLLRTDESDDRRQIVYEVLDSRSDAMLPTIITSNLRMSQIAQQFGERTAQRILEMCARVPMEGVNYREQVAAEGAEVQP